jgi:hypothetical protein
VPTAAKAGERRRCGEFELDELASAEESAAGDETISDDQGFEDAASYKSLDDDRILGEKQGDGRTFYSIRVDLGDLVRPRMPLQYAYKGLYQKLWNCASQATIAIVMTFAKV